MSDNRPTLKEIVASDTAGDGYGKRPIGEEDFKEAIREGNTPKEILSCDRLLKSRCSKEFILKHSNYFKQTQKLTFEEKRKELINEVVEWEEDIEQSLHEFWSALLKFETKNKKVKKTITKLDKSIEKTFYLMRDLMDLMEQKKFLKEKVNGEN